MSSDVQVLVYANLGIFIALALASDDVAGFSALEAVSVAALCTGLALAIWRRFILQATR